MCLFVSACGGCEWRCIHVSVCECVCGERGHIPASPRSSPRAKSIFALTLMLHAKPWSIRVFVYGPEVCVFVDGPGVRVGGVGGALRMVTTELHAMQYVRFPNFL
jgi:hypothetical protein